MKKLEGKVALITGGTSGIGLAIAKSFAEQGAKVAITGRNKATLDKAVEEIGQSALGLQGDVSNLESLTEIFQRVHHGLGKIDVLVANAGAYILAPITDFSEEMFDKVSDINFKGTFFTVQKSLNTLNDGASVILVSSTVNGKGIANHSAYSATKAAVRSLARSFSSELIGRKIRVNTLTPGPIDTPIFGTITSNAEEAKAVAENMSDFTPVKRLGKPSEVAAAALYLASDDSSFMIGSELLLDGGIREL